MLYLFDFEKICQSRFPFWLLLSALHGRREVVDEVWVDFEDHGLRERGHEDVADLLLLVPVSDGLGESDSEERVAVEDLGNSVEQKLDFVVT